MICSECGSKVRCVDTRPGISNHDEVYRLFKCIKCGELIYTEEKPASILDNEFKTKWEESARWKHWKKKQFQEAYGAYDAGEN